MPSDRSPARGLRWAAVPLVAVVVAAGVWITGGVVTDDETIAKGLTAVWLLAAGLVALFVAWRYRSLALPVLGTFAVVAGALGGFLLYTSSVDKVVNEDVLVAEPLSPTSEPTTTRSGTPKPKASEPQASEPTSEPSAEARPANVQVGAGNFVDGEHPTSGVATLIDSANGARVLTLTNFATDPGPDLRVYLVPAGQAGVSGGVDIGALKGNKGDQQYDVPQSAPKAQVVIWCRAFSVNFGTAQLA